MEQVKDLLDDAVKQMSSKGIPDPRIDAEILLAHAFNVDRMHLYMHRDLAVEEAVKTRYERLIQKRISRIPVSYLIGFKEFMNQRIEVNEHVLIPRPETELMVEYVVNLIRNQYYDTAELRILDFGTGSGAIACSCAVELPDAHIVACDTSMQALRVAQKNISKLSVSSRVSLVQSDRIIGAFHMIVSNPPYIKTGQLDCLQEEVAYEPRIALDGGREGTDLIAYLIDESKNALCPNGHLVIEIDPGQAAFVIDRLEKNEAADITVLKDYAGLDRIVSAQYYGGSA